MQHRLMGRERGYSAVELLVVTLILSTLVSVGAPLYSSARRNLDARTCASQITGIMAAESTWAMRHGSYNPHPLNDARGNPPGLVGATDGLGEYLVCPSRRQAYTFSSKKGSLTIRCPNAAEHIAAGGDPKAFVRTMPAPPSERLP